MKAGLQDDQSLGRGSAEQLARPEEPPGPDVKAPAAGGTAARADLSMGAEKADHRTASAGAEQARSTDPISRYFPWASLEERRIRARLLDAQALAASRAHTAQSERSWSVFRIILDTAADWAFRAAPLREVADQLVRLWCIGDAFERLEDRP